MRIAVPTILAALLAALAVPSSALATPTCTISSHQGPAPEGSIALIAGDLVASCTPRWYVQATVYHASGTSWTTAPAHTSVDSNNNPVNCGSGFAGSEGFGCPAGAGPSNYFGAGNEKGIVGPTWDYTFDPVNYHWKVSWVFVDQQTGAVICNEDVNADSVILGSSTC